MMGVSRNTEEINIFKCEICSKVFQKKQALFDHTSDVHRQARHFCCVCKLFFENEPDLIIHNLVCHDTSFIICGRENCCFLQFKTKDELRAHIENMHINFVKRNSQKQTISCEFCGKAFNKAKDLLKHKINIHKVGNVYMCSKCNMFSETVESLMEHEKRSQHPTTHPLITLSSTKPHIILDGKSTIPCKLCKAKFKLGTTFIEHVRLKHAEVINNKGAGQWKCTKCKKEFNKENSLKHHMLDKHKLTKDSVDKDQEAANEEPLPEIEIKIEIKSEPNEYYENLLEMTDLETEAIYNNEQERAREPKLTLEETCKEPVYHSADTDYNIKKEESALEVSDYDIKMEESDDELGINETYKTKMMVKDLEKTSSEVIFNHYKLIEEEVKSGMIRINLPPKFDNMPDGVIKEFFETSYGKIIDFGRHKSGQKKKRGYSISFCWITFSDERACQFLNAQGHVMFDGVKLKIVALKQMGTLRPKHAGSHDILMQKTESYPQSNSLLQDLQVGTSQLEEESDNDSISSMQVECRSCLLCRKKRQVDTYKVSRSRTKQKGKGRSKGKNKKTKHPTMALAQLPSNPIQFSSTSQHQAIPPLQVPARLPPQVHVRPPQVPARPPPQYPTLPPTSYYGYENQPYGWSWDLTGHGYYPAQFCSARWSGDRTQLWRPYCYYDDAGKLVQRRLGNARMWPY